jgi:hypothetical protein
MRPGSRLGTRDLERFNRLMVKRDKETGASRGEVQEGEPE